MRRPLVLTAVGLFVGGTVFGFVLLKPKRTWSTTPVFYIVDDRGVPSISNKDRGLLATISAINSSDAWNGAGANQVVNAIPGSVLGFRLDDGTPMLNFEDPTGLCTGNCLAGTFTGFYQRNRGTVTIYDADIVTNPDVDWTSQDERDGCTGGIEFFIEGVQVHEIGHGLGLGHTSVAGATMFPSVGSCDNGPATTEADDDAGLLALYGSSGDDGDGDGDGGSCGLGQKGDSCSSDGQCCSGKCRGKARAKTCK